MSKKQKSISNSSSDPMALTPGASSLDITEIVQAQLSDEPLEDISEDEGPSDHISISDLRNMASEKMSDHLREEARLLTEEFDADPELKTDVLDQFSQEGTNDQLDHLATTLSEQELQALQHASETLTAVNEEMVTLNEQLIVEDQMLETQIEAQQAEDAVQVEELSEHDQELRAALPKVNEEGTYDLADLQACIEALLFYADRPLSLKKLKELLEMQDAEDAPILEAIAQLKEIFSSGVHGFELCEIAGGYQFRTKTSKAPLLRKMAKVQTQRLSRGAMETLTICAYKQPCTKDDIDQIRGVDSSHFIRTLLDRKLIAITGRAESMGRPMVYETTDLFLEVFGVMDLKALPPLREIEAMVPQLAAAEEGAEDPRVIQMRKMVSQMKTESNSLDYSAKDDETILKEIRDRVKAIEISTPFLETQKQLAEQGLTPEEILSQQMAP